MRAHHRAVHSALPAARRGTDEILRIDADAEAAFEPAAANALPATLGPGEAAALPDCECNTYSKCWGSSCIWVENWCVRSDSGCGTLWTWSRNGLCYGREDTAGRRPG